MDVALGLPNAVPGTKGSDLLEFARRAEAAGFSSLGTLDRIVYPNYDPLVALAGAAAVTERIKLATTILIAPYRQNAVLLAKQAASVHALSGGRLVLAVAIGARDDDYQASGLPTEGRGRRLEEMLEEMKRAWAGEEYGYAGAVGPDVKADPPQLIIGGSVDAAFRRAARYADGWIMGGGAPDQFAEASRQLDEAWREAGREGTPRKMGLAYFALGEDAEATAEQDLKHYYAWLGEYADQIAASAATDAETVKAYIDAFADAGCDELFFFATSSDPEQVDLLAAAAS